VGGRANTRIRESGGTKLYRQSKPRRFLFACCREGIHDVAADAEKRNEKSTTWIGRFSFPGPCAAWCARSRVVAGQKYSVPPRARTEHGEAQSPCLGVVAIGRPARPASRRLVCAPPGRRLGQQSAHSWRGFGGRCPCTDLTSPPRVCLASSASCYRAAAIEPSEV